MANNNSDYLFSNKGFIQGTMKNTIIILMLAIFVFVSLPARAVNEGDYLAKQIVDLSFQMKLARGEVSPTVIEALESKGSAVEVKAAKTYPIAVIDNKTQTILKNLEAVQKSKPVISPSTVELGTKVMRGMGGQLVIVGITHLLGKAVDYVLDPANNTVKTHEPAVDSSPDVVCKYSNGNSITAGQFCSANGATFSKITDSGQVGCSDSYGSSIYGALTCPPAKPAVDKTFPIDQVMQAAKDVADSPSNPDAPKAQDGIKTVVQDMITNNEIDNSVYNNNVYEDNSNEVVNNYITNNYPGASLSGGTKKDNGNGTSTTTVTNITNNPTTNNTTNNNTTNNNNNTTTTTTTETTTNNTTNNITNVNITTTTVTNTTTNNTTINNNPASSATPATSAPASTPAPTSSPSPTKPTDSSKFELPSFCDWAKPACDFIDWVKKDVDDPKDDPIDIQQKDKPDFDLPTLSYTPYVKFNAQCPAPPTFQVFGQTLAFPIKLFCDFCDQFSYVVLAYAWLRALLIVGSGFKGQ